MPITRRTWTSPRRVASFVPTIDGEDGEDGGVDEVEARSDHGGADPQRRGTRDHGARGGDRHDGCRGDATDGGDDSVCPFRAISRRRLPLQPHRQSRRRDRGDFGACRLEDAVHPRTPVARREQALPVRRVLPVSILSSSRLPLLCECRRCTGIGNHAMLKSAAGTIQCSEMSHPGHWFHDRFLPCIAAGSRCRTCSSLGAACNSLMSSSAPFRNVMLLNGTPLRFVAGNAPARRPGALHCVP